MSNPDDKTMQDPVTAQENESPNSEAEVSEGKSDGGNEIMAVDDPVPDSTENSEFKVPIFPPPDFKAPIPTPPPPTQEKKKLIKSPAEQLSEKQQPVPYKEPAWAGIPEEKYFLEVLKGGLIIENVDVSSKSCTVFGRLSNCDSVLEHPSISRFHAVIQYRKEGDESHGAGFYLYDLGSTHGTFLNKQQLKPKSYYKINVGHIIKFGASSRMYIFQGPPEEQEPESDLTVTEIKELRRKQEEEAKRKALEKENEQSVSSTSSSTDSGIDWGMGEDAVEEEDLSINPFALDAPSANEDLYVDDPKKSLRGWFEREGYELEYKVEEKGPAKFLCRVELPIDSPTGQAVYAEALVKGKKKEAVIACALEACKILDKNGLLRQSTHDSRKRKEKKWEENDYYDSDEDTFLDRTGSIESKRTKRMRKDGKADDRRETYDSLVKKLQDIENQISQTFQELNEKKRGDDDDEEDEEDALDAYMTAVTSTGRDNKPISAAKLRMRLQQLQQEKMRLQKLVNIAKPAILPPLKKGFFNQHFGKKTTKAESSSLPPKKMFKFGNISQIPADTEEERKGDLLPENVEEYDSDEESAKKQIIAEAKELKTEGKEEEKVVPVAEKSVPIKGPAFRPPQSKSLGVSIADQISSLKESSGKEKKDRNRHAQAKRAEASSSSVTYDSLDKAKYDVWVPPQGQTGDGKTSLNDKFGY